jgi:hypothetical protein
VGTDELVDKIKEGFLDFDRAVATPSYVPPPRLPLDARHRQQFRALPRPPRHTQPAR